MLKDLGNVIISTTPSTKQTLYILLSNIVIICIIIIFQIVPWTYFLPEEGTLKGTRYLCHLQSSTPQNGLTNYNDWTSLMR